MFVAIRDIRFAKGRFALMGLVVALVTLLIVLLSGLTSGLADQSTSAVTNLPGDHIVFGASGDREPEQSFEDSSVTVDQIETWQSARGVTWAEPLGITQTRVTDADGATAAATLFAARPGGKVSPSGVADGELVLGASLAEDTGVRAGDRLSIGDRTLTIAAVAGDDHYSHTPVVWTSLRTWRSLTPQTNGPDAPQATVVAAKTAAGVDTAAVDDSADTVSVTRSASLDAIGAFSSENGSLLLIQGFLYVIAALVTGAFLSVWTMQRTGDIAILKALGGSTRYLLRDALAQALLLLVAGVSLGSGIGAVLGALVRDAVPFVLTPATTVLPVAAMLALGMAGAVFAVRRITSVDPLTALGGVR